MTWSFSLQSAKWRSGFGALVSLARTISTVTAGPMMRDGAELTVEEDGVGKCEDGENMRIPSKKPPFG